MNYQWLSSSVMLNGEPIRADRCVNERENSLVVVEVETDVVEVVSLVLDEEPAKILVSVGHDP